MQLSRYAITVNPARWDMPPVMRAIILLAVALGVGALVWAIGFRASVGAGAPTDATAQDRLRVDIPVVRTEEVRKADAARWTVATGTVKPQLEAVAATRVTGRVVEVLAREGDRVRKGQLLIRLDARDLDASIAQAGANVRAAAVGVETARVTAEMEGARSTARIAEARAGVAQAEAAVQNAKSRRDLVQSGPRRQERIQASLATLQAKSNYQLAETELRRMEILVREGVISRQKFDGIKTQYEVAKAQYDAAKQAESLTEEGSRVEDIRSAEEGLRQAEAALEQARAGLKLAQAAALEVKVRKQHVQTARAQLGQSDAAMRAARAARDYATITAPFDGVISARLADPGAMAAPGVPLLKVQGGPMRLEAVVPEAALGAAKPGVRVPVELDALDSREITGRVVEISPQGDAASHTFLAKVELPAIPGVKAGMFGRARLRTGTERKLLAPAAAVFEREGLHYALVVGEDGLAQLRLVAVGETERGLTTILSGLREGERVIVEGRERAADGARVRER